ncbi:MAG: MotA/TolQ/ExbB proton channel family protein, partial [Planctomycetes bacterium]|nr:MotA/TolQ/ExbB proton channel family protein [Planctomycetota bacterium]
VMGSKKVIWLMLIVFVGLMAICPMLMAQDDDDQDIPKESLFTRYVVAGGPIGAFIIVLMVAALALVIEHFVNINRNKLCPPEVIAELEALVDEGQYEEAITLCSANQNFFCNIIGAALSKMNDGYEAMIQAMEETGLEEANKLHQKISYLSLIGNTAPMIGLLGTVVGMINSFMVIKSVAAPSPKLLAGGITTALATTVLGLVAAIPALSFNFFFKNKVNRYILEIGMICGEFIDKFKQLPVENAPAEQ